MHHRDRIRALASALFAAGILSLGTAQPAPGGSTDHADDGTTPDKGAPARPPVTTITGEVMDPACYLEAGAKSIGPGHFQCAVDCARSGQTLAIYDRDLDRIYFVAGELPGKNPNAPLFPYIHKKVDVRGTVYHRSGVYGIVILRVAPHDPKAVKSNDAAASEPTKSSESSRSKSSDTAEHDHSGH